MPAPPTRPRLRARYDRRREEVLMVCAEAFAERGYHATSMNDLVEATQLAAGGLYHYIVNKEKLLVSIFEQMLTPLLAEAEEIVASSDSPEDQLRALLRGWVAHVERYRAHMTVFQREWRVVADQPGWEEVREARRRFERILGDLINRVHEETGRPRQPQLARMAVLGMVNYTPQWFDPQGPFTPEEVADGYCELILGRHQGHRTSGKRNAAVADAKA
jgi:AcrR family transcriptional regulator